VGALTWLASTAEDFDYFTVYGSTSSAFNVSAVEIGHTIGTGFNVTANDYPYYYVSATDFSGNEGKPSKVTKQTGVNDLPSYHLDVNAYPNPFNPLTSIHYDVPANGRVVVRVYDLSGALVRTLVDAPRSAGSYAVPWEGRDDRGEQVGSGVYFVKISFGGRTKARKVALVK
jgi:hypothetical protein